MSESNRRVARLRPLVAALVVALFSLPSIHCSSSDGAPPWVQLPTDDEGFTILPPPSADSRVIYVSSSAGDDGNDGSSPDSPIQTVAHGTSLLRHGFPDHLLFRRGDVWNEGFGSLVVGGRSATEPMVIGAYGELTEPRPRFEVPDGRMGLSYTGAGGAPDSISHFAVVSLDLVAIDRAPGSGDAHPDSEAGFTFLRGTNGFLVEDCVFQYFSSGMIIEEDGGRPMNNIAIRRNLFLDSWRAQNVGHSQGIYVYNIVNLLIEENILDHNGWSEHHDAAHPTLFNHGMYIQNSTRSRGIVVRGNIVMRGSSHGIQLRPGGLAEGNFFARVPISLLISNTPGNSHETSAHALDNVVVEGIDTTPRDGTTAPEDHPRGWGIDVDQDIASGSVLRNVVSHCQGGLCFSIRSDRPVEYGENIIWEWEADTASHLPPTTGPYPDPDRSVASYSASLGRPESFEAFVDELRLQRKGNWRPAYAAGAVNDYFRAGFGL